MCTHLLHAPAHFATDVCATLQVGNTPYASPATILFQVGVRPATAGVPASAALLS